MTDQEKSGWVKQAIDETIRLERQRKHDLVQRRVRVLIQRSRERRNRT